MPAPIAQRLSAALDRALADHTVQDRLGQVGVEPEFESPARFGELIRSE